MYIIVYKTNKIMTPKEKAKELVTKFINIDSDSEMFDGFKMTLFYSQRCALIAVDESINILDEICKSSGYDPFESPLYDLKYWKEVKQEIEKL